MSNSVEARVERLHLFGIVDMHFDLLMDLYDKREHKGVLEEDFWPELQAGGIGVLGAAIYVEDQYMPEMALRVGLDQVARLYAELEQSTHFALCRTHDEIDSTTGLAGNVRELMERKPTRRSPRLLLARSRAVGGRSVRPRPRR